MTRSNPLKSFTRSLSFRKHRRLRRSLQHSRRHALLAQIELLEDRALLSSISGTVFEDTNGNGVFDSGEPGIDGARVFLDANENGLHDSAEVDAITVGGAYEFTNLSEGLYTVTQELPLGTMQTAPDPATGPDLLGKVTSSIQYAPPMFTNPPQRHEQPLGMTFAGESLFQIDWGSRSETTNNVVFEIDPATGDVLDHFVTPGNVWDITFDGTYFWGARRFGEIVQFTDVDGDNDGIADIVSGPFTVSDYLRGIAWDGASLWTLDYSSIFQVDPDDGSILDSFSAPGSDPFGLTYDGHFLWTNAHAAGRTYQIDPESGSVLRSFMTPYDQEPLATGVAWNGKQLWMSQFDDELIVATDVSLPGSQVIAVDGTNDIANVDFGRFQLGTATGHVFEDLNGNGTQDAGEPDLEGWTVYFSAPFDQVSAQTDTNGNFSLSGIPEGSSSLSIDLRDLGWVATTGAAQAVVLETSGDVAGPSANFGVQLQSVGPVGEELRLSETIAGSQDLAQVALHSDGSFVAVWDGNGPGDSDGIFMRRFAADGTPLTSELPVNTTTRNVQERAQIAMADDGSFAVTWYSDGDVVVRLFNPDGSPRSDEIDVYRAKRIDAREPTGIAMDADGDFAILYGVRESYTYDSYYVQRFDSTGSARGNPILIHGGEYYSAWSSNGSIVMDDVGNFIVGWEQVPFFKVQRFDALGNPVGNVISLGDSTAIGMQSIDLGMNSSGAFVAAWTSSFGDGNLSSWLQAFDADGTARAPAFAHDRAANWPSVSLSNDGQIVVAHTGKASSSYGYESDILLSVFDFYGTASVEDRVINTSREGGQEYPRMAMNDRGEFVIAWRSKEVDPDGSNAVFAQRFQAPPVPEVAIDDVSVTEGDSGTTTATFTVTRAGDSAPAFTVDWATADGTATTADGDYVAASGTLTFATAEISKTVTVIVNGDTAQEGDETFFVNLANATAGATISDSQGVGTILDDDQPISTLQVLEVNPNFASPGDQLIVTVTGTGFVDGATVDFGKRVNVQSVTWVSATRLDVQIKVHPKANLGTRNVTVTNPDGTADTLAGGFTVGTSAAATLSGFDLSSDGETATNAESQPGNEPLVAPGQVPLAESGDPTDRELRDSSTQADITDSFQESSVHDVDELFTELGGQLLDELLAV